MQRVMFLPGQVDHWNTITDMGFQSMWSLPRQQVQAIAQVSQDNMLYMLFKSFYLNTSWGQTLAYKMMSPFLHPETKEKINLTDKNTHPDLLAMYHPC